MATVTNWGGYSSNTTNTEDPGEDPWGGGGWGYGGGGYGGGGGGGPYSETNRTTDVTTTRNKTDINTEAITSPDLGGQKNLLANAQATIDALVNQQNELRSIYDDAVLGNKAIMLQRKLELDRNANEDWQDQVRKLQMVNKALTWSLGNGNYGQGANSLAGLIRTYDDMQDAMQLQALRQGYNENYQDYYGKTLDLANDYNTALAGNQNEMWDAVLSYLTDYNSLLGTKTGQRNQTDQTETSKTSETTETRTDVNGNHTTSTVNSTHDIDNMTTGNNKITNTVSTDISPYLDENGNLDYNKVGAALHIKLSRSGTAELGKKVHPEKLQQQNIYRNTDRSTAANVAALSRRYG